MAADDLSTPLGLEEKKPSAARRWLPLLGLGALWSVVALGALAFAAIAVFIAVVDDPLGGEPVALASIERALPGGIKAPAEAAPAPLAAISNNAPPPPAETEAAAPQNGPLIIKVPGSGTGPAAKGSTSADPELSETTRHGPIPRIGDDGTRPFERYARSTVAEADDTRPKIALVVGGLGVSREATSRVFELLPRSVTLAFTPYSSDLETWVAKARGEGYEFLLQVPMEPFDYPNSDPGPQALLASLPTEANLDRLTWAMSRASGYYGLTNLMGGKFLSSDKALQPVLTEMGRRGLVFLDDGRVPSSLARRIGPNAGAVTDQAQIVIDAVPDSAAIAAALAQLEDLARRTGGAIGSASALPVTLAEIEKWAAHLTSKGIVLVPVSAVVKLSNPA